MQVLERANALFADLRFKHDVRKTVRAVLAPLSINAMREVLELGGYRELQPRTQPSAVDAAFNIVAQGLPRALRTLKPDAKSLEAFGLDERSTAADVIAGIRRLTDNVVAAGGTPAQAERLFHRIKCTLDGVPIEELNDCSEKSGAAAAATT